MKEKRQKKQRNTPRFGVLDAVIILLIIVAVVGVYFRYNILNFITGAASLSDYTVSYTIEDIRYTTPNFIDIGDKVYFADGGDELGTLIAASENKSALEITPASEYFTNTNGELVEIMYPDQTRVNGKGRLVCKGRYSSDGSFLVGGSSYVAAGQYIDVKTDYVSVTIRVEQITVYEGE